MAIAELGKTPRVAHAPTATTAGADPKAAPVAAETPATGSSAHVAAVKHAVGHTQARILAGEAGMENTLSTASTRQHTGKDFLGGHRRLATENTPERSDMMRGGGGGAKPPAPMPSPPQAPRLQPLKHGDTDVVAHGHETAGKGLGSLAGKLEEKLGGPDVRRPPISTSSQVPSPAHQHEGPPKDLPGALGTHGDADVAGRGAEKLMQALGEKLGSGVGLPSAAAADVGVGVKKHPTSSPETNEHAMGAHMSRRLPGKNPLPKPTPPGAPRHQNAKVPI